MRKISRFEETRRAMLYRLIFSKRVRWSRVIFLSNNTLDRVYLQDESSSSSSTSHVRAKFESGSNFYFYFFSVLFISSDCYSRNDVPVVNGKLNFQVCNIFHHRSLEPFNTAVERYATSLCVHNFSKNIKTCSCIHLKQRYHFHD